MTVDHTVLMLRDPDLAEAPIFICLDIKETDMVLVLDERECE